MNRIVKSMIRRYEMLEMDLKSNEEIKKEYNNSIENISEEIQKNKEDLIDIRFILNEAGIEFDKCYKEYKEEIKKTKTKNTVK